MLNSTIILKVKERLNKLDSQDYDNLQTWQIVEAFNKGQVEWCRRNLHGTNAKQEGDEGSTSRIDDLQVLLTTTPLTMTQRGIYYETVVWPDDYMRFKRISTYAKNDCCAEPIRMVVYLAEVANVDNLLRDKYKQPSYDWAETFATLEGNKIHIYANNQFEIVNPELIYYRQPRKIEIAGVKDPYTNLTPTVDITSEFKDDLVELMVTECVNILSGDIESFSQNQISSQSAETNN